jgi:hypothetical protein
MIFDKIIESLSECKERESLVLKYLKYSAKNSINSSIFFMRQF